jgi:hypothetical protein
LSRNGLLPRRFAAASRNERDLDRLRDHRRGDRALRLGPAAGRRRLRRLRDRALGHRGPHAQPEPRGFGDPATVFVASLFVASAALEKTGVTAWVGQALIRGAGTSRAWLLGLMMLCCGGLSALISVNGAVAALLPVVVILAVRLRRAPSQMLMPLVFGAHAGSMLALTGTPVNVLLLDAAQDAGLEPFGYFEFAWVGVPLLAGTIAVGILFGRRLLPHRESRALPPDLSDHARTLVEQFRLGDDLHQLRVRAGSPISGRPRIGFALPEGAGLGLVTVRRDAAEARIATVEPGDTLLVRGPADAAAALATRWHLSPRDDGSASLARACSTAPRDSPRW